MGLPAVSAMEKHRSPMTMNPPRPQHAPAPPDRRGGGIDRLSWIILGLFLAASLLAALISYPIYRYNSNRLGADRAEREQDYAAAIRHLRPLTVDPARYGGQGWGFVRRLGEAHLALEQPSEAIEQFERLRQAVPDSPLDEQFAIAYAQQGEKEKAFEHLRRLLEREPENPAGNYMLGVERMEAGDWAAAGRAFYLTAADPRWDRLAQPHRRELARLVKGGQPVAPEQAKD